MPVTKAVKLAIRAEFQAIGKRAGATFDTDQFATRVGHVNWTVETGLGPLSCRLCDGLELNERGRTDPYARPWVIGRFHDLERVRPHASQFLRPLSLTTGKWNWHELHSVDELHSFEALIDRLRSFTQ